MRSCSSPRRRGTAWPRVARNALLFAFPGPNPLWIIPSVAAAPHAFDWLGIPPNPPESTTTSFTFRLNGVSNEDYSFFGPLGVLLVALGIVFAGAWLRGRVDARAGALALALPLYVIAVALSYRYNTWIGRFMIVPSQRLAGGRRVAAHPGQSRGLALGGTSAVHLGSCLEGVE